MILDAGYNIGTPNKMSCIKHPILCYNDQAQRPPCVSDWLNEEISGFYLVGEGDEGKKNAKKGDILAADTFVGIVSRNQKTISAAEDEIVENDWGFRGTEKKLKVFRYEGD